MLGSKVYIKKNSIGHVLFDTIGIFKVKRTLYNLTKRLESHAYYPSLLSIKDVLLEYGIQSVAIRKSDFKFENFHPPFICIIQKDNQPHSNFTLVTNVNDRQLKYLDPDLGRYKTISEEAFDSIDKGYILLIDGDDAKDEDDFYQNRKKGILKSLHRCIPFFLILLSLSISINNLLNNNSEELSWYPWLLLTGSFCGLLASNLLLWLEVDSESPFLKEICDGKGEKINCNKVLSSKGANFLGFSWAFWGVTYFTTFFLSQILFENQPYNIHVLSISSILVSPYIVFSILYQWLKVKNWCTLCLLVQSVLFVLFISSVIYIIFSDNIEVVLSYVIKNFALWGLAFLIFNIIIPIIKKAKNSSEYKKRWDRLRYHPEVFNALLLKSEFVKIPVNNIGILLGDNNAKNEIIKICNPYCSPCAKSHPELDYLIKTTPNLSVRIIFIATGENNDKKTLPVAHMLAIQEIYGPNKLKLALDDWYLAKEKDYEQFANKYPVNIELLSLQKEKIKAMYNWCKLMKIRSTPTIYLNGYELPEGYKIEEMKNIL